MTLTAQMTLTLAPDANVYGKNRRVIRLRVTPSTRLVEKV